MINNAVQIVYIDFPAKGRESVVKNEDDSYTIFLNSRLSREQQFLAYMHALKHIQNDDFEKDNADKIEYDTHNMEMSTEFLQYACDTVLDMMYN